MRKFKINGVGEPFDGLIVYSSTGAVDGLVMVDRIEHENALLNSFSLPIAPNSIFVNECVLEQYVEDSLEELLTNNPYGKHVANGTIEKDYTVFWSVFENAMQVSGRDSYDHCLFSHVFYSTPARTSAWDYLGQLVKGELDWDDLPFMLRALADEER